AVPRRAEDGQPVDLAACDACQLVLDQTQVPPAPIPSRACIFEPRQKIVARLPPLEARARLRVQKRLECFQLLPHGARMAPNVQQRHYATRGRLRDASRIFFCASCNFSSSSIVSSPSRAFTQSDKILPTVPASLRSIFPLSTARAISSCQTRASACVRSGGSAACHSNLSSLSVRALPPTAAICLRCSMRSGSCVTHSPVLSLRPQSQPHGSPLAFRPPASPQVGFRSVMHPHSSLNVPPAGRFCPRG